MQPPRDHSNASRPKTLALLLSFLIGPPLSLLETAEAGAQVVQDTVGPARDPHGPYIAEAARRFGVPEGWIRAVMRIESRGDVRAISPKGAMGLMQIMPATWAYLSAKYGLGSDPYEPRDNILAGAAYLREMHDRYGAPGFLAAYNAGPGRYEDYRSRGRPLPDETLAYVAAIGPVIGAPALAPGTVIAAVDPSAWTRSPLFIGHRGDASTAEAPPTGRASYPPSFGGAVEDAAPSAGAGDAIFIVRPGNGAPR